MPTYCRHMWPRSFLRPGSRKEGRIRSGRAERLPGAVRTDSGECRIEGSVSRKGMWLRHVAEGQSYARRPIDTSRRESSSSASRLRPAHRANG